MRHGPYSGLKQAEEFLLGQLRAGQRGKSYNRGAVAEYRIGFAGLGRTGNK